MELRGARRPSPVLLCAALACFPNLFGSSTAFTFPGIIPKNKGLPTKPWSEVTSFLHTDSTKITVDSVAIDPMLTVVLSETGQSSVDLGGIVSASDGVKVWRSSLAKGRLPVAMDFVLNQEWPQTPIFDKLSAAMVSLELPRFALRHPEAISAIILSVLRITMDFMEDLRLRDEIEMQDIYNGEMQQPETPNEKVDVQTPIDAIIAPDSKLAEEISSIFMDEWGRVVGGMNLLDQVFGYDHGLLQVQDDGNAGSPVGFGLQDGIWEHSGWKEIPDLQSQIASMSELKDLVKQLGRRPTAKDADSVERFAPRKANRYGGPGPEFDPQVRDSVSGITLSGSFSEMLPSEAALLQGRSPALRRLFLAKKVESKLLSYQLSGWEDVPSIPATRPLYSKRLPSAPGGPIIVCLDTSWSMSGMRERLSKAVTLACVTAAHKQGRNCQVVAFSTSNNVIESGVITADSGGIQRLLDFLSHSFGGGTDVTGALKFALQSLASDDLAAADMLLITDGEIPDPPVSDEIMEHLDRLKLRKGVKVYGLLVGRGESKPLSRLCCKTHDFLLGYETPGASEVHFTKSKNAMASEHSRSSLCRNRNLSVTSRTRQEFICVRPPSISPRRGQSTFLHAKYSRYDDGYDERPRKGGRKGRRRQRVEDLNELYNEPGVSADRQNASNSALDNADDDSANYDDEYTQRVSTVFSALMDFTEQELTKDMRESIPLSSEANLAGACAKFQGQLRVAIDRVGEGLVERSEEARLVVLAMISNEHVLLLGVPGTGKSVLGRRLSKLCNGAFFQRLLTRFTTPEELFGPLSLRSLENDEYRRCTAGFLPTASIAFLDEIFKANSAILNTLLTILNERKFDNAGGQEDCPIRCVVGASNELPESDELVALFDRFLIRKEVLPVSDDGLMELIAMSNPGYSSCDSDFSEDACDLVFTDSLDDVVLSLSRAAEQVVMDTEACALMRDLRKYMKEQQSVEISDRRIVKTSRLLKICAASHGRTNVEPIDCLILQHCMWQIPEQKAKLRDWLWENITPGSQAGGPSSSVDQFRFLLEGLRQEIVPLLRKTAGDVNGNRGGMGQDIEAISVLRSEVRQLADALLQQKNDLLRHIQLLKGSKAYLWLDPDDAKAVNQILVPKAESRLIGVDRALRDARALERSLDNTASFSMPDDLRVSVVELLWESGYSFEVVFTEDELSIGMKEAKAKYDLETFRKWKRAKKKSQK